MIESFGTTRDGQTVQSITLGSPEGLQAEVLTYGGILRRLTLPARGRRRDLILSLPTLHAYDRDPAYLGILVGRFGNRIANARYQHDGVQHQLTANEGANQLHGGKLGFGKRLWKLKDMQTGAYPRVWIELLSPAGEEGYPGNLSVIAEIAVEPSELSLIFEARCDAATPLNLTYHPYFNLSGEPGNPLSDHLLRMPASRYLPVIDSHLIPTGQLEWVVNTQFDFRIRRKFTGVDAASVPQLRYGNGYDHCWALEENRDCDAELVSETSGVTMKIKSDRPGLQFYGGQGLPGVYPGLHGICLEPQGFPNSVNEPHFPTGIWPAGKVFRSEFRYAFKVD
jgi:aldose 1-epimerase